MSLSVGRSDDDDLVMKGHVISRLHARIEFRHNEFVLIDQSTNGTFRAERRLGRLPEQGSPHTIRFTCEEL